MKKKAPLVVLRSNDVCFLGILRSCGYAGIPVVPVVYYWEGSGPWFSERSKYYKSPVTIPNPAKDEKGAIDALVSLGKHLLEKYGLRTMIIPSSDTNLMLLQNNFELLSPYFKQMGANDFRTARLDLIRKDSFAKIMEESGIPIPKTISCLSVDEIDFAVENISYPCVYKPVVKDYVQSFQNSHNMLKAIECHSPEELRPRLYKEIAEGYELIVQEKIHFGENANESSCHVYVGADQNIRIASTSNKEGEFPKPYGSGTISRLTWKEELLPIAQRVANALKWRGMMGIELMKDKTTGQWNVIEINFRPWLHIHLQCSFGLNHFKALYEDAYSPRPSFNGILTPSKELIEQKPLNINLSVALRNAFQGDEILFNQLQEWVEGLKESKPTFEYIDPDDPEPGIMELEHLESILPRPLRLLTKAILSIYTSITGDSRY